VVAEFPDEADPEQRLHVLDPFVVLQRGPQEGIEHGVRASLRGHGGLPGVQVEERCRSPQVAGDEVDDTVGGAQLQRGRVELGG
jgi:hypothetical protein